MDGATGIRREGKKIIGIDHLGVYYPMTGMTDKDYEEVGRFILANRKSPMMAIKEQLEELADSPALQAAMFDRAYADMRKNDKINNVTRKQIDEFLDTKEGVEMSMWMMIRRVDPSVTRERAKQIIDEVAAAEDSKGVAVAATGTGTTEKAAEPTEEATPTE